MYVYCVYPAISKTPGAVVFVIVL